ncbi:MAG: 50S ribosomal protein L25 [Microgenomates group bacterium]
MTEEKTKKEKVALKVEKRTLFGRKVKKLRKEGILPANIFGAKIKSLAVQLPLKEFMDVYKKVGETGIVELKVEGEKEVRPVLIHNLHFDPITDLPLHVDFRQVSLKEKITTNIPVEVVGESPAVAQKIGILVQILNEIEVEALPGELPEKFIVDASQLKEVDQAITVADLKIPEGIKILTSPQQILVKIEPPAKEEVTAPPTEEKPVETPSGEEKPKEEKPEEKPSEENK